MLAVRWLPHNGLDCSDAGASVCIAWRARAVEGKLIDAASDASYSSSASPAHQGQRQSEGVGELTIRLNPQKAARYDEVTQDLRIVGV